MIGRQINETTPPFRWIDRPRRRHFGRPIIRIGTTVPIRIEFRDHAKRVPIPPQQIAESIRRAIVSDNLSGATDDALLIILNFNPFARWPQ